MKTLLLFAWEEPTIEVLPPALHSLCFPGKPARVQDIGVLFRSANTVVDCTGVIIRRHLFSKDTYRTPLSWH